MLIDMRFTRSLIVNFIPNLFISSIAAAPNSTTQTNHYPLLKHQYEKCIERRGDRSDSGPGLVKPTAPEAGNRHTLYSKRRQEFENLPRCDGNPRYRRVRAVIGLLYYNLREPCIFAVILFIVKQKGSADSWSL